MILYSDSALNKFLIIAFLLLSILCIPQQTKASNCIVTQKFRIAVIPERGDLDFWKLLKKGATQAAIDNGNVKILWIAPNIEDNLKEQQRKIEWCIENHVDAIVISPIHSLKMKTSINNALKEGIPVIQMVSGISFGKNSGYVHSNNFQGGILAAKYLNEKLDGKGSVVLGMFERGNSPVLSRIKGFKHQLDKSGSQIKIAKSFYLDENEKRNKSKIHIAMWRGKLNHKKNVKTDAVIGMNESSCETLLKNLKEMDMMKGITFVAFNPDPNMVKDIQQGIISAGIAQDPYKIGKIAIDQAVMAAKGKSIPPETTTEVHLITKENLQQPEIREVLGLKERNI
jgi:ribose transport system substrate-binding protein